MLPKEMSHCTRNILISTLLVGLGMQAASARATRESYIPDNPGTTPSRAVPSQAATDCPDCKRLRGFLLTLSGGPLSTSNEKAQTFFLQPNVQKTYTANRTNAGNATGEVFLGYESIIEEGMFGQLGLAVAFTSTKVNGDIWEDANPVFSDFTYQYNAKRTRIAAKSKLATDLFYNIAGYVSGSAGFAVNRSSGFTITPRIFPAVPAPLFNSNSEIGFSYTLGLGLEKTLTSAWRAGIGYEFADWGPSALARAPGQSLNNGLGMSHLYTNALMFSLTFIA